MRKRQRDGIDDVLQMGITFGRPKAKVTEDFKSSDSVALGFAKVVRNHHKVSSNKFGESNKVYKKSLL